MKFIKKVLRKVKKILKYSISLLFYLCPIKKNRITVYNFNGKGYGDNPRYLIEELRKDKKYEIIWIVSDMSCAFPSDIKKVKYGSLKALYYMTTARLWLDTIRNNPKPLFKRKKQYYIQMWHGGIVTKGHEADTIEVLSKSYIKAAKKDSKFADFILSNCKDRTEIIKRAYWYNGEILELGIPRDDVLFFPNKKEVEEFKERYGLKDKKIVLYAPSFRNSESFYTNNQVFDVKKLIKVLNEKFGGDFVFCYRMHPNDEKRKLELSKVDGAIDLMKEQDSQFVLSACDVVISDYSSMWTDFTLTGRPTFIYAPDYEDFIKNERMMYFDLKNCMAPFAETFDKLLDIIKNFDYNKYNNDRTQHYKKCGLFEDGTSSKKIKEYLQDKGII